MDTRDGADSGAFPRRRIDPELAAINVLIPRFDFNDLVRSREFEALLAEQGRSPVEGVSSVDHVVARPDGTSITARVYRPDGLKGALPALLYIHGGAFMLGGLHTEEERCELYAKLGGCVVVAVDYRLSPEHVYPDAFNDCIDTLAWMASTARGLGIDRARLAVGGNSAGGALAASVALQCRLPEYPRLVHQLLINPALDHRSDTHSATYFVDTPVWTRGDNLLMWDAYLGSSPGAVDYRASPALATELDGVANMSIWTAEYDPLRDEGLAYASALLRAGVSVAIYQYPGTFHGFDSYRMTTVGQRALADQIYALRRAFIR